VDVPESDLSDALEEFVRAYGEPLTFWALNIDSRPADLNALDDERLQALLLMRPWAIRVNRETSSDARNFARTTIVTPPMASGALEEGPITAIRRSLGGSFPSAESTDEVESLLLRICRDVYPSELIDWEPTGFPESMRFHTANLAASQEFCKAALADPSLSSLFPGFDPSSIGSQTSSYSIVSYVERQSGRGGSLQLVSLATGMIHYGMTIARIKGSSDLETIFHEVKGALGVVRKLADGVEVDLAGAATLGNIMLPEGMPVEISSIGTVYPWSTDSEPPVFSAAGGVPVTAVLLASFSEKIVQVVQGVQSPDGVIQRRRDLEGVRRRHEEFWERIERTRLSFVLSSDSGAILAPVLCAWGPIDPLALGQAHSFSASFGAPLPQITLTPELVENVERWASQIRLPAGSLDIGIRRLLSAATSRIDQLDGLIDAVMCWENLFGDTPETMFKVCGALARLLEPDDQEARAGRFRRLRDIYTIRSKLVHGASEPKLADREALRLEAIQVALDALRLVLVSEELMSCRDSVERAKLMLLGFPR
jgi:hypothetical protein